MLYPYTHPPTDLSLLCSRMRLLDYLRWNKCSLVIRPGQVLHAQHHPRHRRLLVRIGAPVQDDLPDDGLGRAAGAGAGPRGLHVGRPGLRPVDADGTGDDGTADPRHLQCLRVGYPAVEVRAAAARGPRASRRNGPRLLHGHQQER